MHNNTYPAYADFIISVHRMIMENRPGDPDNIQAGESPTDILHKTKYKTRANDRR